MSDVLYDWMGQINWKVSVWKRSKCISWYNNGQFEITVNIKYNFLIQTKATQKRKFFQIFNRNATQKNLGWLRQQLCTEYIKTHQRKIVHYDMTLGYVMEQKGFEMMETYSSYIENIMFRFDWFMKWIWIRLYEKNKFLCRLKNKSQSFLFVWKIFCMYWRSSCLL